MAKLAIVLMFMTLAIAMPIVHSTRKGAKEMDEWFRKVSFPKEKVTKLHFYFHDRVSGENPTAVRVAQASITHKSPTLFGQINMMDDPLTEGPEPTSKPVGRFQGLYGYPGQEEMTLLMAVSIVFTSGEYNGSTLSILGWNPILRSIREMPVVGGSGVFRLARGIAVAETYFYNGTAAIVELDVWVSHY